MAVAPAVPHVQQTTTRQTLKDAPVPKQKRTTTGALVLLLIAAVGNLVIIAIVVSRGESVTAPPIHAPPAPAMRSALGSAAVLPSSFGEGRFVVGTDIAPGTYRTTGKAGHYDCYWERLKDSSGTSESIIANSLAPGPATVTIDKADGAFQTRWCRPWTRVN
ncbi:MAG: hypothetical protein JO296_19205 [Pseudonocardiales bacterium]|jgi:hypothetical protein|nr:hypothetical protein [Pseudonocardiales bacterium]